MEVRDQEESCHTSHYRIDWGVQASQLGENIQQRVVINLDLGLFEIDLKVYPERVYPRNLLFHQRPILERLDSIVVFGKGYGDWI